MAHAIRMEGLTKRFFQRGEVVAVDHLNLDVAEGEIFGFLGPIGAGKKDHHDLHAHRPARGRSPVHRRPHRPPDLARPRNLARWQVE